MMQEAENLSLDELRVLLAPAVARAAVFDGWGDEAVRSAAAERACRKMSPFMPLMRARWQ
jgi:ubiquinone biosynthesis protein COQ9